MYPPLAVCTALNLLYQVTLEDIHHKFRLRPCSGIGAKVGRFARQLQGALPLVGIISRLASPSGGIASDKLV